MTVETDRVVRKLETTKTVLSQKQSGQHGAFVQEGIDRLYALEDQVIELGNQVKELSERVTELTQSSSGDLLGVDEYGSEELTEGVEGDEQSA